MEDPVSRRGPVEAAGAAVFVLATPGELARALAGRLWGIARELAAKGPVHVLLSGGETPRTGYRTLASEPYRERFPWDAVHFWMADERYLPPEDPRSNRGMIEETLLSRAPVPRGRFHGIDTSLPDPAESARRYEEDLRRKVPGPAPGAPRFDAAVLGIGSDGHTASLFPDSRSLSENRALALPVEGGDPSVPRVTVTLPLINAAARILFVAQGEGKARVLHDVVAANRDPALRTPAMPATLVAPGRGTVVFLADAAAAERIPTGWRRAG